MALTTWAAITTASTVYCGWAPWPPVPRMVSVNMSAPAIMAPGRTDTCPTGSSDHTCRPITRSMPSSTPASIIGLAPRPRSSAG